MLVLEIFRALNAEADARAQLHALLHDDPVAISCDDEAVKIKIEAILYGSAVDLCHEAAGAGQRSAIEAGAVANGDQFVGRFQRVATPAAADKEAKFALERPEAALQGADDAGGDAGGVPIHPHDGPEALEPERMRETGKKGISAVMGNDGFSDHGTELRHAIGKPARDVARMERKIGTA